MGVKLPRNQHRVQDQKYFGQGFATIFEKPYSKSVEMKTPILTVCLCMLFLHCIYADSSVDLRIVTNFYEPETQSLYVDVEVQYTGEGELVLADQNYRIYYDAGNLKMDTKESRSELPANLYSPIKFLEIIEGVEVDDIGNLTFDNNLGFLNFSIDLIDDINGGVHIEKASEWTRIAVLKFHVENRVNSSQIVWSEPGKTDEYATAYVQMMEWKGPNFTKPVKVDKHINLDFGEQGISYDPGISIGPNPTTHLLKIDFHRKVTESILVSIMDNVGRTVMVEEFEKGIREFELDVSDLHSSSYILEIQDKENHQRVFADSFVLMK